MTKYKVINSQNVSSQCIVCGEDNPFSLRGHFYNLENGDLYAILNPLSEHQSYPGRLHGGVAGAIIDEVGGRVVNAKPARAKGEEALVFGVTMDLKVRYRKPTPYGEPLYCIAHEMRETSRFMEAQAYIYTMDGKLCVEGWVRYIQASQDEIQGGAGDLDEKDWHPDPLPAPEFVEIPVYPEFKPIK